MDIFNQIFHYFKYFLPLLGIISTLTIRLFDYSNSDFLIQNFYKSIGIQLLAKIVKPLTVVFVNLVFSSFILAYIGLIIKIKSLKDFSELYNEVIQGKYTETIIFILLTCIICIGTIQFLAYIFVHGKNQHLKIKESKLFINSSLLKNTYLFLPEDIPIYISQNIKNDSILCYYKINGQLYRRILPKSILSEFPIQTDTKESFFKYKEKTNTFAQKSLCRAKSILVLAAILLILILIYTESILITLIMLIQFSFYLFPTIKFVLIQSRHKSSK